YGPLAEPWVAGGRRAVLGRTAGSGGVVGGDPLAAAQPAKASGGE
ncbi:SPOR domain-containing protein, partial [Azospirillum brasilense]|nr:SPOR domain-containing protein [Azospirillum brasilense]